jgi:hypothetical protein
VAAIPLVLFVFWYAATFRFRRRHRGEAKAAWEKFTAQSEALATSFSQLVVLAFGLGGLLVVAVALLSVSADKWLLEWMAALFGFVGAVLVLSELREWVSDAKMPLFLLVVAAVFLSKRAPLPSGEVRLGALLHFVRQEWWPLFESVLVAFLVGHLLFYAGEGLRLLNSRVSWRPPASTMEVYGSLTSETAQKMVGIAFLFFALVLQMRVA